MQWARLSGFNPVITTASLHNTELLKSHGATHVIDRKLSQDAIVEQVHVIVVGGLVDVAYDTIVEEIQGLEEYLDEELHNYEDEIQ